MPMFSGYKMFLCKCFLEWQKQIAHKIMERFLSVTLWTPLSVSGVEKKEGQNHF